jgi:hypothetical protein
VTNEIRAVLTRHLPGYEIRSLAKLGAGLDNVVYEVNGELVVRLSPYFSRHRWRAAPKKGL